MRRRLIAEAVGTFALVFVACGAIAVDDYSGIIGHAGVSLTFGLVVMAMIYAVGDVSGAHINPAVTIAFWRANRLPGDLVVPYILAQLGGAAFAAFLLRLIFPQAATLGSTHVDGLIWGGYLLEIVMTFLLMLVILNIATGHKEKGITAGVAVGGTVAMLAMFGGPVTGASLNPARSFGPALAEFNFEQFWLYATAPVLGAVIAVPFCRWLRGADCCDKEPTQ